ncbi:hypothetical protein CRUP_010534 [Coryphaenoides rupestris]|nr:hypothetical protein CRUP_010534 [Coryphaenoides rupestris]
MCQQYTQTLAMVTQWYNRLQSTILPVELGLVRDEMDRTRRQLSPALQELTWAQDDLWDYIQTTRDLVQGVSSRVHESKANVQEIQALMTKVSHQAFVTRKKGATLLVFADVEESENQSLLAVSQPGGPEWRAYTDFVDGVVLAGCSSGVRCSLQYFLENTDAAAAAAAGATQAIAPLFEVQLVLSGKEMTFAPSLDLSQQGNFYDVVDKMVANIAKMASYIPRTDIDEMPDLVELCHVIRSRARAAIAKVREYQGSFASYRYLWTDDRFWSILITSEFMRQFLLYGHVLSTEEAELYADYELKRNPPTLDNFKEQINLFESLYVRVNKMDDRRVFCGWLQLDIRPFKHTLMNTIKRWSWMFKEHLLNHVNKSVRDLSTFVQDTARGLASKVSDGDYAGLVDIMGHLMAIRDRQISTEQHFQPLTSTAELLKTYGQQLPESVYTQLEELPEKWKSLRKVAFTVKHEVAPLQSNEVAVIRRKCARFEVKQHEFREAYRTEAIFKVDVSEPYRMIDKTNRSVAVLEAEMRKLQDTADLFEVGFPDYKQLHRCRSDLILVKAVWDMVIFVKTSIADWTKTPWKEINVEQMDMELRRFAKEMKTLDKEVRVWNVYAGLESTVKNMLTSLRAVNELQNSAVRFVMNESTTLGDLLELQLHRVEDEVKNIVDKAVKEMGIEKSIGNIYKGLAQTGVWGCFDEFNRISVEVLSVVAVQVKTIQDAVRNKKQRFHFLGEEIELRPTVGIFITLNPGYAGRAELPENLKALFRPCAMVIPDFELICEIMLVAEGFIDARLLARKFISLYTLCKELLSKQDHYDWGLRAIKSVLVVAGSLKREDRSRPEEQRRVDRATNEPTDRQRPRHLHLAQRRGLEAELERAGRACRDLGRLASLANHMVAQALCSLGQREATSFLKGVVQPRRAFEWDRDDALWFFAEEEEEEEEEVMRRSRRGGA